jgi:2-polyprenyl-3-methyl-5-hydroxy-6-metoxy-1,4-benzoquinol methylase
MIEPERIQVTDDAPAGVSAHYDAVASEYHLQYRREQFGDLLDYPANYFRLQILVNRLASIGARRVYEVGVGEGTPLVTLASMGLEVAGCDISEAMVRRAKARLAEAGLAESAVAWGDIRDSVTIAPHLSDGSFDAAIAAGVLPHVESDSLFLENLKMLLCPGGTAFVEFRNKLFSLFTFNRKTKEFILEDLLAGVDPAVLGAVADELDRRLALDQPPTSLTAAEDAPGYDAILARFHNPFELLGTFARHGFRNARIHWYHYHPAPPLLESLLEERFRTAAMALEHDPSDWRGYFLCSAGVIEASAPE